MTKARLTFGVGDPIEFSLEDVVAHGPQFRGFRAWLGAVFASSSGHWVIHFSGDAVLGFRRDELRRLRLTASGAELTLGEETAQRVIAVREADILAYGPEPEDLRSWLGRLAHGGGEAWLRFADGRELRFAIGNGPHVRFLEPTERPPAS